jgi:NAD(P)-dependent dehydrogenase (short-subunit alcohol dehydrogenase family)
LELKDKVALVTGAGKRVGRAIALALAGQGASVAVHYHHSEQEATATAAEIARLGIRAEVFRADLAEPQAAAQLIEQASAAFGRIDVLVNSASAFQAKAALDITVEDWDAVMAVNLRAPFFLCQHAAKIMKAHGGGVIVNMADIAGQTPWPRFAHHSISKAGVIMLTRVLAKAFAPDIRVNAVAPGPVLKPDGMPDERWVRLGAAIPMRRTGSPEDVAKVVLALIDNDFTTGAVWNVDGGDALVGSVDSL